MANRHGQPLDCPHTIHPHTILLTWCVKWPLKNSGTCKEKRTHPNVNYEQRKLNIHILTNTQIFCMEESCLVQCSLTNQRPIYSKPLSIYVGPHIGCGWICSKPFKKQSWHMFASTCNRMLICSNGMRFANICMYNLLIFFFPRIISSGQTLIMSFHSLKQGLCFFHSRFNDFFIHQQARHNFTLEPFNGRLCNQLTCNRLP